MYTLIIVSLLSGGFTNTTLFNFSSQATCQAAATSITTANKTLGTKSGVFQVSCVAN